MLRMIIVIAALLAGLLLGPEISANKGYVLVSVDGYTSYETTIINAVFIALIFYFLLLVSEWLLRKLFAMSAVTRGWFGLRKTKKAQKNSLLGMLALFEGNAKQAQKLLAKSATRSEAPALNYIAAAKAAHLQGKYDLRDDHLQRACDSQKECHLAAGLTWVKLQIDAQQYENALATLQDVATNYPKNKKIALLYLDIYPALTEWEKYLTVLQTKQKTLGLSEKQFDTCLADGYSHYFKQLAEQGGETLKTWWDKKAPRWLCKELTYQQFLLDAYIGAGQYKMAELFLLEKLHKQFSLPLLTYLKQLEINDFYPLIILLEKRLKKEKNNGLIHQTLARLKFKENQNEAAIEHLKISLKTEPDLDDFVLLANLLEKKDQLTEANHYYREGLLFASS